MTDIEICQRDMLYAILTLGMVLETRTDAGLHAQKQQRLRRQPGSPAVRTASELEEDLAMTAEIFYLTAQIQRWLNLQVARHLEAQASRFSR